MVINWDCPLKFCSEYFISGFTIDKRKYQFVFIKNEPLFNSKLGLMSNRSVRVHSKITKMKQ